MLSSGRPATQPLPPIARNADRDRTAYVELGSGRYVEPSARKPVEFGEGGRSISLNFVDVELQEFVRVMFDEILKETVVVDPALKGSVTIRTSAPVNRAAALDLVRQALNANGASLVQSGNVYRVVARNDQRTARRVGDSIRIVPINYIGADEAKLALASLAQNGVEIGASATGRYLTVSGPPNDLDNLEQLLATLDVDQMKGMSIALLPLREAGAPSVANELTQVFGRGAGNESRAFRSMPVTRMNAVLIIASQPHLLSEARKWVARLDRADHDGRRIYVYPVQNRRAPEIAKTLGGILGRTRATGPEVPEKPVAPQLTPVTSASGSKGLAPGPIPASAEDAEPVADTPTAHGGKAQSLRVTADAQTNSIVVTAMPDEWRVIEAALRRLDIVAPQILVEATIAEVRLNASLRHGVRWFFQSGKHGVALTDDPAGSMAPVFPGFNYIFGMPNARVSLNALEEVTDVEIVSSPALTVLDNQTAKLQVGDQVPIATRSARSVINPDAPIVNDIEFKDTGVILSVTPHVNASGLVVIDVVQEVSDVVPTTSSDLNSPTIRQRRINSSVAVHSGMEVVLGGLIGSSRAKANNGIPLLMDIPVVGNAFKLRATRSADRSELLVILRPTVMGTRLDIESITREIKSRISGAAGAVYR